MTPRNTIPDGNIAEAETAMREVVQRLAENLSFTKQPQAPFASRRVAHAARK